MLMLNDVKAPDDIYDFCLKNPKICAKNKNFICKKILISSGYKKFLTKNYCLIFKELLNIKKRIKKRTFTGNVDRQQSIKFNYLHDILMTQVLWNYCKVYGSIELKHFVNINKPEWIIDYQYEELWCIYETDSNNTIITLDNEKCSKIYSEINLV
jgi:hypothetical protein